MSFFMVKAIKPRKRIDAYQFSLAIMKELENQGQIAKRMYQKTTTTWRSPRPVFRVETKIARPPGPRGGRESRPASVSVYTSDDRYIWTDYGTKPHIIRPRRSKYLRFRVGYKAKTRVRVIGSRRGGKFGSWVSAKIVRHPGTKAREFTKEIQKRRRRPFHEAMAKAIEKAQKRYAW